ncbi:MAG: hypothetical protein J2P31_07645, partial [Blastocatellia bacterium]|nr:hypothetical protein [Blastocatellia bacterium]
MLFLILEIPVSLIGKDERYQEEDGHYIYDHLKHVLSLPRSFPLPAIQVGLVGGKLVVTGRDIYLRIAR